jgi:predicted metal-dependent peptidase
MNILPSEEFTEQVGLALLGLYAVDKYLYNVAARVAIIPGDVVKGMAACPGYTNGVTIFFPEPFMKLDQTTQLMVLTHEVLHIVCKHMVRIQPLVDFDMYRMNVAADLSIMGYQMQLGQKTYIEDLVPDAMKYRDMDMFEIYDLLTPEDGKHDLGHPEIDKDILVPTDEEVFGVDRAIQQAGIQAEAEGYSTSLTRSATRHINKVRAKSIPWDRYLAKTVSNAKSELLCWARPNRRMFSQLYLPSRRTKEMFQATMAMDVSGSVGEDSLNQIAAVAQDLLTRYVTELHLMTFDDKIVDEWTLKRKDKLVELELNGWGGTYVQVVIDHLIEIKRKPKLLIIATDGKIPKTEDPGYPVIWLIVDNIRFTSTYGTVLHINSEELK